MRRYQMKYRDHPVLKTGLIEASSLEKAEELGRQWCASQPPKPHGKPLQFVSVEDVVLIREEER